MKLIILSLILISFSYAEQYTFLVKKYDKEIELEAKIISEIASSSIKNAVKLFIPNISKIEKKIYSKYMTLGKNCEESNFIFVNKPLDSKLICEKYDKLFFTNNYKKLLNNEQYYGAFFWNKSRPNIVFIQNRLEREQLTLPRSYTQFIENI